MTDKITNSESKIILQMPDEYIYGTKSEAEKGAKPIIKRRTRFYANCVRINGIISALPMILIALVMLISNHGNGEFSLYLFGFLSLMGLPAGCYILTSRVHSLWQLLIVSVLGGVFMLYGIGVTIFAHAVIFIFANLNDNTSSPNNGVVPVMVVIGIHLLSFLCLLVLTVLYLIERIRQR